ncbi:hypothetical protein G6F63_014986 [Rhizopus arrhizus]|nr:hypothetical protein G6F63_014986 [Rhizopus arrhizus]
MRAVEQAEVTLEAVLRRRFGVVQGAVLQAGHGVDDHRRAQLAPGQHVIAEGNLLVDIGFQETLVDAFVAAAAQDHARQCRQFPHLGLGQRCALRAEACNGSISITMPGPPPNGRSSTRR